MNIKSNIKNNIEKYEPRQQRHLWGKNVVVSSEGYVQKYVVRNFWREYALIYQTIKNYSSL